jgi:hypothetical protein
MAMTQAKNSQQVRADGLADVLASFGAQSAGSSSPMMVFRNPVSGLGTSRDRLIYTQLNEAALLDREDCDALYMHWICRRVVDHVADEITRVGWTVQMGLDSNATEVPGIEAALRQLEADAVLNEAIKAARQYGGSAIVMYLDDGRDASEPVDWANLKAVTGLEAVRSLVSAARHPAHHRALQPPGALRPQPAGSAERRAGQDSPRAGVAL